MEHLTRKIYMRQHIPELPVPHTSCFIRNGVIVQPSIPKSRYVIETMLGLGDTLYQRAYIRAYPGAYVKTPWPELFSDMDVKCVPSNGTPHYQVNDAKTNTNFVTDPLYLEELEKIRFFYYPADLETIEPRTIMGSFDRTSIRTRDRSVPLVWDLPNLPKSKHPGCAVIRTASSRGKECTPSRCCDPVYLKIAAHKLKEAGYTVVTVNFEKAGMEWTIDPPDAVDVDFNYNKGELSVLELLALLKEASVCVGTVSWFVPAVYCAGTKSAVIMGGYQLHNSPYQLVDDHQSADNITWFQTDKPCLCSDMEHVCDKTITNFEEKFDQWLIN